MEYDITPYVKPERVLNFNFSTQMLLRCIEKKYAKSFVEGEIYLSQPKSWIEEEKNGNKGKGDRLEGIFFSCKEDDNSEFIERLRKEENLNNFPYDGYRFFRKKSIESVYCLCFYGLNNNSYTKKSIDKNGKAHYTCVIEKNFFESFSEKISKEEYIKTPEMDKPVVIFISNPKEFFKRIKNSLKKMGLSEHEIIISPVDYINKKKVALAALPYPKELLLKDKFFEKQNEIRIIINSQNKTFLDYMKKNNNIIKIGNIEDIAQIYDYYFEDLIFERKSNKSVVFNLPHEEVESFESMSLIRILTIIGQAYLNDLPDSCINQKKEIIDTMKKVLEERFGVYIEYENGTIHLFNTNDEVSSCLDEYCEPYMKVQAYEKNLYTLIDSEQYQKAYNQIALNKEDKNFKQINIFFIGKILEKNEVFEKAIKNFDYCINNEIKLEDAISSRAYCYTRLGKYELALKDLDLLQDTIGYNPQIYSNKGINLIYLNKLQKAIEEFNKSIEMQENNACAYYNRSVAYYRLKDYKQAKKDIKKALNYDPTNDFYNNEYKKYYKNLKD